MGTALILGGLVAVVVAVLAVMWTRRANPVRVAIREAIETRKVAPIVRAMQGTTFLDAGTAWHKTFEALWQAYERELAARLLVEAATVHDSDVIASWTRKIVEVEPELALKVLGRDFIIEKLELPEDAIPKSAGRAPRRGERATPKKKKKVAR